MVLKKSNPILIYILILVFINFLWMLFAFRTNAFFSIDDFRVLAYFKGHTVLQMIPDFLMHGDIFHYRKLVGFIVFGSLFENFGTNPNAFIAAMFLIQTANAILLFFVLRFLTKRDFASFFLSVVFTKFYLFYFSNLHEICAAFFILLSIFLYFKYPQKIYFSLTAYVLALFSKELAYSLPFFLLAVGIIRKQNLKRTYPFFAVLILYALYQTFFVFYLKDRSFIGAYGVTLSLKNFYEMILFYLSPVLIGVLVLAPLAAKRYKPLLILGVFFMTILPVLFFGARREMYYIYIPAIYLLSYISMYLPEISLKSAILYLLIFAVFGGRSILPKVARQNFPNWQKVSLEKVVGRVRPGLAGYPPEANIDISDIKLERDANLMLENGVLGLFVGKDYSGQYSFVYNQVEGSIKAVRI